MQKIQIIALITLTLLLLGCTNLTPEEIAKYNQSVQEFIDQHPNAEISYSIYYSEQVGQLQKIFPDCTIPEDEDYYLIKVNDESANLRLNILIHKGSNATICALQEASDIDHTNNNNDEDDEIEVNIKNNSGSCKEDWDCTSWKTCKDGEQTRTCTDDNKCGTTKNKPATTKECCSTECTEWTDNCDSEGVKYRSCEFQNCDDDYIEEYNVFENCGVETCEEDWSCSEWNACTNGTQTRTCTDDNECGTTNNKPTTQQNCTPLNLNTCDAKNGTICNQNEVCDGLALTADDTDNCCSGNCNLKTCDAQGGYICQDGYFCNSNTLSSSSSGTCCENSCISVCENVYCASNQKCVAGTCELKSCTELSGNICTQDQVCLTTSENTTDGVCCLDTCAETGTLTIEFIAGPGTSQEHVDLFNGEEFNLFNFGIVGNFSAIVQNNKVIFEKLPLNKLYDSSNTIYNENNSPIATEGIFIDFIEDGQIIQKKVYLGVNNYWNFLDSNQNLIPLNQITVNSLCFESTTQVDYCPEIYNGMSLESLLYSNPYNYNMSINSDTSVTEISNVKYHFDLNYNNQTELVEINIVQGYAEFDYILGD